MCSLLSRAQTLTVRCVIGLKTTFDSCRVLLIVTNYTEFNSVDLEESIRTDHPVKTPVPHYLFCKFLVPNAVVFFSAANKPVGIVGLNAVYHGMRFDCRLESFDLHVIASGRRN